MKKVIAVAILLPVILALFLVIGSSAGFLELDSRWSDIFKTIGIQIRPGHFLSYNPEYVPVATDDELIYIDGGSDRIYGRDFVEPQEHIQLASDTITEYGLRDSLKKDGWRILLCELRSIKKIAAYSGHTGSLLGLCLYNEKLIICCRSNFSASQQALLHECGHYIDYKNGYASNTPKFRDIHRKEKSAYSEMIYNSDTMWGLMDKYDGFELTDSGGGYVLTADQYFADAFANCKLHPGEMKENCPLTFEYFESLKIN